MLERMLQDSDGDGLTDVEEGFFGTDSDNLTPMVMAFQMEKKSVLI